MKVVILLLAAVSLSHGYHILCIQNVPSKSHYYLMKGIVDPLLEAGHQVTWISVFPDPKPVKNLKYIDISHVEKLKEHIDMTHRSNQGMGVVKEFGRNISLATLQTPAVKKALVTQNFDAVVTEWFFSDVDAGYGAALKVPWILLSGMILHTHMESIVDTVRTVPTIPNIMLNYEIPMNFWQRIMNTVGYFFMTGSTLMDYSTITSDYENLYGPIAKSRGVTLPPFSDALHNVSVMLVNSHPSFAPAQSLPPNVVEIAGYHISEHVPPLPKDLQDLLDSSQQGVVYFSMGSVLKSSELPDKTKNELIKMFGELPYTILWKFEEKLDNLPKNVHIRSWMPQSSILSHPNVKAFITHGGLLSTLESLHFGMPIVAIPVFGDQPSNALRSVRAGYALKVDFNPETLVGPLKVAITEMVSNDSYYKRAKYLSKLFRTRPVSNKKLIQHYVELAIESKGAYHLRSTSLLYSWYQLWMLDQIALLLLIVYIIVRTVKKIINLITIKKNVKDKKKKTQ